MNLNAIIQVTVSLKTIRNTEKVENNSIFDITLYTQYKNVYLLPTFFRPSVLRPALLQMLTLWKFNAMVCLSVLMTAPKQWGLICKLKESRLSTFVNRDLKIYNATGSTTRFEFQLENEP